VVPAVAGSNPVAHPPRKRCTAGLLRFRYLRVSVASARWQREWQLAAGLVLAAVLTAVAPAHAGEIAGTPRVVRTALELKVPLPPGHITVSTDECPESPGEGMACAYPTLGEIYLAGGVDRFVLAHELGAVFDERVLTDRDRARLTRLLGARGPWHQGTGMHCIGRGCASELFADAYATRAKGDRLYRVTRRRGRRRSRTSDRGRRTGSCAGPPAQRS
jgi:hypothetical protein